MATARLLFVDDEEPILNSLRRLFRGEDYDIDVTTNPEEGLDWVTSRPYDLVISDMRMPNMDGATFLQAVAEFAPRTIRLLLTGYSEQDATVRAINLGRIHAYLTKPWQNDELRSKVADALRTKVCADEKEKMVSRLQFVNKKLEASNRDFRHEVDVKKQELEQTASFLDCAHEELKTSYSKTITIFAQLINQRMPEQLNIAAKVEADAVALLTALGGDEEQVETLRHAAQLFQLGKLGLPDRLLNEPYYRLNEDDRTQYDQYPVLAEPLLMEIAALRPSLNIIRHHNEVLDGSGFPSGLAAASIPFGARVLKPIIDYHMMVAGQLAPELASPHDAKLYLQSQVGRRYDEQIVQAYLHYLDSINDSDPNLSHARILSAHDTTCGSVLCRDVFSNDGMLLLAKGTVLHAALLGRLREWEKREAQTLYLMTREPFH